MSSSAAASRRLNNYAFIDSQNLNVGVQKFGWKMDWVKFRKFLSDNYDVNNAYMFIGYVPEFENLYEQMHEAGYLVVLKPTFDMTRPQPEAPDPVPAPADAAAPSPEPEEKKPVKGNIDADMVLWAMKELPHYDKAVIVSGDGDFYSLVEYLHQLGKLAKLLTPNQHYSGLFHQYNDYVAPLTQWRRSLAYRDRNTGFKTRRRP